MYIYRQIVMQSHVKQLSHYILTHLHEDKLIQTNSLHQFTINTTSRFHTHKTKPPFHQQKPPHRVCWGKFHLHLDTCIEHHWGRCLSRGIIRRQGYSLLKVAVSHPLYIADSSITYWQIYYWDCKPVYSSEHWRGVYYLDCTIALISIP